MEINKELNKIVIGLNQLKPWAGDRVFLFFENGKFELIPGAISISGQPPLFTFTKFDINHGLRSIQWDQLTKVVHQTCKKHIIKKGAKNNV